MILLGTGKARSFKESLKSLEADIQHANRMALGLPKGNTGACLQMRLSYGPAAHFLLCFFTWTDCSLAGALGLLHILIYKVLKDGTTTMSTCERKASFKEFYAYILPSLECLEGGLTEKSVLEQKAICMNKYQKTNVETGRKSHDDLERERECGICLEIRSKIVLPDCSHSMCIRCYRDWRSRSLSCPFCRASLKRVNSRDLWVYMDQTDVKDPVALTNDNIQRLFTYVDKLPLAVSNNAYDAKRKIVL